MQPKRQDRGAFELFQAHFDQLLNPNHELIQLARKFDWECFDVALAGGTSSNTRSMNQTNRWSNVGSKTPTGKTSAVLPTPEACVPAPPDEHDQVAQPRRG